MAQQQATQYILCPPGFVPTQGQQVVYLVQCPPQQGAPPIPGGMVGESQLPQFAFQPGPGGTGMLQLLPAPGMAPPAFAPYQQPPVHASAPSGMPPLYNQSPMASPSSAHLSSTKRSGSHQGGAVRHPGKRRHGGGDALAQTFSASGSITNLGLTQNSGGSGPTTALPNAGSVPPAFVESEDNPSFYNSGTFNSITSLDGEFTVDPVMDQSDPAANAMIAELRKEPTDRAVRARVLKLPPALCISMVVALDRSPGLMMELCLKERGNIICHLIEKLGGDQCFCLVKFALDNFRTLALNQSGCIALPRILQYVKPSQRDVFFDAVLENFTVFITHPFGNYVVKHFLTTKEPAHLRGIVAAISESKDDSFLQVIATNKFGSHVLDDVFKQCTDDSAKPLVARMFRDPEVLRVLAHDPFGNYNVQSAFRYVNGVLAEPALQSWCLSQIIPVVGTSQYQQNIMKHAVSGFRTTTKPLAPGPPGPTSAPPVPGAGPYSYYCQDPTGVPANVQ